MGSRPGSVMAPRRSRAASGHAWRLPGRSWPTSGCWSSTSRPPTSTMPPPSSWPPRCSPRTVGGRSSGSPTSRSGSTSSRRSCAFPALARTRSPHASRATLLDILHERATTPIRVFLLDDHEVVRAGPARPARGAAATSRSSASPGLRPGGHRTGSRRCAPTSPSSTPGSPTGRHRGLPRRSAPSTPRSRR